MKRAYHTTSEGRGSLLDRGAIFLLLILKYVVQVLLWEEWEMVCVCVCFRVCMACGGGKKNMFAHARERACEGACEQARERDRERDLTAASTH